MKFAASAVGAPHKDGLRHDRSLTAMKILDERVGRTNLKGSTDCRLPVLPPGRIGLQILVEEHESLVGLALTRQVLIRHEKDGTKGLVERQRLGNRLFRHVGQSVTPVGSTSCHRHDRRHESVHLPQLRGPQSPLSASSQLAPSNRASVLGSPRARDFRTTSSLGNEFGWESIAPGTVLVSDDFGRLWAGTAVAMGALPFIAEGIGPSSSVRIPV